jgi:sugar lactone lactonase YvrE
MNLWKKTLRQVAAVDKKTGPSTAPEIHKITPAAALPGGEFAIWGKGFARNGGSRPTVRFGEVPGEILISSATRLIVRVPEGVEKGHLTVDAGGGAVSLPIRIILGRKLAENLHPVANPAIDAAGNIFSTFSGSRGQKAPVSIYKLRRDGILQPFVSDLLNATGLAFDRSGLLYVSSRAEGNIYQITPDGHRSIYAGGMGIATGIAFDAQENLYVGDRTGTIFRINRDRQIFVFATLEPSIAGYHLAFGSDGCLYVTGPTTSSYDQVYRVSANGEVASFYRGLGRPQGLAFDAEGNLCVAASLSGRQGIVRITPQGRAELFVSGYNLVGLAFTGQRSMIVATHNALMELSTNIEGMPLLR